MTLVFEEVSVAAATRQIFRYLGAVHLFVAVYIVAVGGGTPLAWSALLFVAGSAWVNGWRRYRRGPFALLASVATCLAFVLPLAFVVGMGEAYQFGNGLPYPDLGGAAKAAAPLAIVYLTVFHLVASAGLAMATPRQEVPVEALMRGLQPAMAVGILGGIVLFLAVQTRAAFILTKVTGESGGESLLQFIFFDQAYLMLLPLVIALRLLPGSGFGAARTRWEFGIILALFYAEATFGSTSKGFIMTLFVVAYAIPLSYLQSSRHLSCLMPTRGAMVAAVVLSLGMFFVVQGLRAAVFTGMASSGTEIATVAFERLAAFDFAETFSDVGYRLGASLDRYVLIFSTHHGEQYLPAYAVEYGTYLLKNLANLLLLGTPYPEAYAPSSNLFHSVITKAPMFGQATAAELIRSLNTQPSTIFGVAIILTGSLAPIFVFALFGAIALMYRLFTGMPARMALLCLYNLLLQCFGFEVSIATALHFFGSLFLFVWMMRAFARLSQAGGFIRPVRTFPQST